MIKIKIMNEFLHGPIWVYNSDGCVILDSYITNNPEIKALNEKAELLYSSYYHFDSKNDTYFFDYKKEKDDKFIMLDIITKLKKLLEGQNNNSFIIEDLETPRLNAL